MNHCVFLLWWESLRRKSLVTFAVCLLYLIHSQWQKKRPIQRARHGEGEPFSHSACGKLLLHTVHAICIWPILFPKVPAREESVERSQNSSNPSILQSSNLQGPVLWHSAWHFCLGNVSCICITFQALILRQTHSYGIFSYFKQQMCAKASVQFFVSGWKLNLTQ